MSKAKKTFLIAVLSTAPAIAQNTPTDVLPMPLVDARAVNPQARPAALTPGEKARLSLKNTIGPRAIANRALLAGINQWQGHPEEWGGGMEGYSKRFGNRMARLAIRNGIRLGTDVAFGLDPRYDRCECKTFWSRTGQAWKRVVVSRTDSGGQFLAVSNLTGAFVTPMITYSWYPDRLQTWDRKIDSAMWNLGWRGATNMIREFWPDIRRKLRRQ